MTSLLYFPKQLTSFRKSGTTKSGSINRAEVLTGELLSDVYYKVDFAK